MARAASTLADSYISHLNGLNQTRRKVERLFNAGELVRRDIEQVYSGLYLDAVTSLENLIENLFIGLLVGSVAPTHSGINPRVTFKSPLIAREIVLGGRNYVDWLPFDHTEKRSKAFFRNGAPFTNLEKADKGQMDRFLSVRHAIAHKSSHSQRVFEQRVIGSAPLTNREKTPAGFLRSVFRVAPVQTRYESLMDDMQIIARKLCV